MILFIYDHTFEGLLTCISMPTSAKPFQTRS